MSEPREPEQETVEGPETDSGYRLRVGQFEGPLDLLLHLVRANEVEIADIPIVEITDQYRQYLEMMRELNLEIAGEYLVMAATLMHIKSRMLLPPDPDALSEEGEEDPRAELARELLEYQRFKQAAENLSAMDSRRSLIWNRESIPEEFRDEELLTVELFDLLKAFRGLLGRLSDEAQRELRRDTVSVADKITWLSELLARRRTIDLFELFEDLPSRIDCIATFLAMLEMIRLRLIVVFQRRAMGDIRLAWTGDEAPGDGAVEEPS